MNTYIALLRGINVGGKNVLPMKDLVQIFDGLGYSGVRTYIQSGNVVFRTRGKAGSREAAAVSAAIAEVMGFAPHVLLLDAEALRAAIDGNPFPTHEGRTLHFYFLDSKSSRPDIDRLERLRTESEQYHLSGTVLYLYAPDGIGRSKLASAVEAALGVTVTARNWYTVAKLAELAGES